MSMPALMAPRLIRWASAPQLCSPMTGRLTALPRYAPSIQCWTSASRAQRLRGYLVAIAETYGDTSLLNRCPVRFVERRLYSVIAT
jgi:hypothetical protein